MLPAEIAQRRANITYYIALQMHSEDILNRVRAPANIHFEFRLCTHANMRPLHAGLMFQLEFIKTASRANLTRKFSPPCVSSASIVIGALLRGGGAKWLYKHSGLQGRRGLTRLRPGCRVDLCAGPGALSQNNSPRIALSRRQWVSRENYNGR